MRNGVDVAGYMTFSHVYWGLLVSNSALRYTKLKRQPYTYICFIVNLECCFTEASCLT